VGGNLNIKHQTPNFKKAPSTKSQRPCYKRVYELLEQRGSSKYEAEKEKEKEPNYDAGLRNA
jgi:hypothetical protein